jgi:[ribosomal protein S18]-alanine N-acetyltransferase
MVDPLHGYTVSVATIRDVHPIRRLEQIVFPVDAYSYLSLTSLLMWPGGVNFKAVDHNSIVVGFVAGSPNYGTETDWIVTLGVHPKHQRRGLGVLLLTTCENQMSQPTIALTVRASNYGAIRLYENMGYVRAYIEPSYYQDGEDGIVMQKHRNNLKLR